LCGVSGAELARCGRLEYRRELPLQLPGVEEELPVDVVAQRRQVGLDDTRARELGYVKVGERDTLPVRPRLGEREQRLAALLLVLLAQALLLLAVLGV